MTISKLPSAWIQPEWPAPANVVAVTSTRQPPYEQEDNTYRLATGYDAFNLALHVNDDPSVVEENRTKLSAVCGLDETNLRWLEQVHSNKVLMADSWSDPPQADASYTRTKGEACVVMTADCLPVLFCNKEGSQVAAAHAGWRGLADGILSKTVESFDSSEDILAWLGPAIGPTAFEVGDDVYQSFCSTSSGAAQAFVPTGSAGKWFADLYQLAKLELNALGINAVYGGTYCTFTDNSRFYSYRRDGAQSGRMASLIYLE